MNTALVLVAAIAGLLHGSLVQAFIFEGQCDSNVTGMPDFNVTMYIGQWFEMERYPQPFPMGQCNRGNYSPGQGDLINVLNTRVVSQSLLSQPGTAQEANPGFGHLEVTFDMGATNTTADLFILDTDYSNYALLYSCQNIDNETMQVGSWKLSRTRTNFTVDSVNAIDSYIANSTLLNATLYQVTSQSEEDCFYIPQFDPDQAVQFRGTCDNLVGQANFDIQRYLGWWHELYSYPTGTDTGTCISTQYLQQGNETEFITTQVNGESIRGSVEVLENAKLRKNWVTQGHSIGQDYWVLGTDYETYSVVLSCVVIPSTEYVRVWSTLLSKSQHLTANAVLAINDVVNRNPYLISDFFLYVNQTSEACFPDQPGTQVVLPGQCDETIPAQPGFNITEYVGTWYHIETYPYPDLHPNATCIGSRYTPTTNNAIVNVLNWQMVGGNLVSVSGQATVSDGVLAITYSGNENTTLLRVLMTDYSSFSLAYTCQNINPYQRVVEAYKLSRTREMPTLGALAINGYIATRSELHQPFFIPVTHNECRDPNSSFLVKSSIFVVLLCYVINSLM